MSSTRVVEAVDVLEQCIGYLPACLPFVAPDEFSLDGFEESFDSGIVVAISLSPAVSAFVRSTQTYDWPG
jgi:hypothetical protein